MGSVLSFLCAVVVNIVGAVLILFAGLGCCSLSVVAHILGFRKAGIAAGSMAARSQSWYGNLLSGSIISTLTSSAMRG